MEIPPTTNKGVEGEFKVQSYKGALVVFPVKNNYLIYQSEIDWNGVECNRNLFNLLVKLLLFLIIFENLSAASKASTST
jgi:hypothetical protein